MWIKVGNERINLDNVTDVSEFECHTLRRLDDGIWYESTSAVRPEELTSGTVVDITFIATSDGGSAYSIRLVKEQAKEFLELFNAYAYVVDIEIWRAARETEV